MDEDSLQECLNQIDFLIGSAPVGPHYCALTAFCRKFAIRSIWINRDMFASLRNTSRHQVKHDSALLEGDGHMCGKMNRARDIILGRP